jgi:hypothetical protein
MFTSQISKIFVVLLVLAFALVSASFVADSTPAAADLSYDSLEQVRASRSFMSAPDLDAQIENVRLQRALVLIAGDASYDVIEQIRSSRTLASAASSYDQVENIRAQRTLAPATMDTSYSMVEQVRLERGHVADRSYDNIEAIRLLR